MFPGKADDRCFLTQLQDKYTEQAFIACACLKSQNDCVSAMKRLCNHICANGVDEYFKVRAS